MKIDVAPLQHLMKGSHLGEDNSHTRTWCSDNIDYKIEHAMYKCLDLYPQPLHGWEIGGSPTCSFEILVAFDMECGMAFVQHEDNLSFHILHQWKPKDLKKADHKSLCKGGKMLPSLDESLY